MRLVPGLVLVAGLAATAGAADPPPLDKPVALTFDRKSKVNGVLPTHVFDLPAAPGDRFRFQIGPKDPKAPVLAQVEVFEEGKLAAGQVLEESGIPGQTVDFTMHKSAGGRRLTVRVVARSYGTIELRVTKVGATTDQPAASPNARTADLEQQVSDLRKEVEQLRALVAELSALVRKPSPPAKKAAAVPPG